MANRLYRGVPLEWHNEGRGLKPRGATAEYCGVWGEPDRYWGDGGVWGASPINGALEHQIKQRSYPDSAFISTTPHFHRARLYALHSAPEGIVYEIDPERFSAHGVQVFEISKIVKLAKVLGAPDDDEHALLTDPHGAPLPSGVVVAEHRVRRPV